MRKYSFYKNKIKNNRNKIKNKEKVEWLNRKVI